MSKTFDNDNDDDQDEQTEKKKKSSEFSRMLEDSFRQTRKKLSIGDRIKGEILSIGKEDVYVTTGTIHDGVVAKKHLLDSENQLKHKIGDVIDLYVTQIRGSEIYLSPTPSDKSVASDLEDAFDMMLPVEGRVTEVCKGGFRVSVRGKLAFCPISQIDQKRVENPEEYVGLRADFRITQFAEGGKKIVVSRRKILEEEKGLAQTAFTEEHKVGEILPGTVTRLESFGAFVEISPGIEGLLHISEFSWSRVSNPRDLLQEEQKILVKILNIEELEGKLKISLSMKQIESTPWQNLPSFIKGGEKVVGKVTRCMKFGAFVEIAPGIEGLIPLSEMSDTKRVMRSNEIVKEGEQVEVLIKEVNPTDRRILLSFKSQYDQNSDEWRNFAPQNSSSLGTLGDQFREAFEKKKKS